MKSEEGMKTMTPIKKYKITYKMVLKPRTVVIEATSKYNAKERFYRKYPKYEIIKVEAICDE